MATAGVLEARDLHKSYKQGDAVEVVLDGVSVEVPEGRFVSIMGPSGSGKSTLLHLLGGLDTPDRGDVLLDGQPLSAMSDDDRTRLRRHKIGIVYQFFNLVPVLSAEENVALPAVIAGQSPSAYEKKLFEVLELVGMSAHKDKQPAQLSGGQQQRVAIARALFIEPAVLLADEPTGNVDMNTGAEILELFTAAQRELGQTIVMVTHDARSASYGDEVLLLRGGSIVSQLQIPARLRAVPTRTARVLKWLEQA